MHVPSMLAASVLHNCCSCASCRACSPTLRPSHTAFARTCRLQPLQVPRNPGAGGAPQGPATLLPQCVPCHGGPPGAGRPAALPADLLPSLQSCCLTCRLVACCIPSSPAASWGMSAAALPLLITPACLPHLCSSIAGAQDVRGPVRLPCPAADCSANCCASSFASVWIAQVRKTFEDLYAEALRINEGRPSLEPYAQVGCAVAAGVHEPSACSPRSPRCCPAAAVPHPTPARPTLGAGRPAGRRWPPRRWACR